MKFLQLRKGMLVKHRDAIPFPPPPSERVGVVVCTTGFSETCPDSVKVLWNGGEIESHWTDELEVIREAG